MRTPYLIQRGWFEDNIDNFDGIDDLIRFEYMGAAEFEFGATYRSLKRIALKKDELKIYSYDKDNIPIFIICKPNEIDEYRIFISALIENKIHLKEHSYLDYLFGFGKRDNWQTKTNFWWDLDNDVMFCLGKMNAQNVLKSIFHCYKHFEENDDLNVEDEY